MDAKQTKVELFCTPNGRTEALGFDHAERLLRMPNNGGWELPKDSPFEFIENALRFKRGAKSGKWAR